MGGATAGAPSRKEARRAQHQELSRNQLLDAAEEVFGTKGYHAATLKEVADRAEFSVGSVYSFFGSKDDLFLHVFLRRGEAFLAGAREVVAIDRSPLDRLRALVAFEVGFFRAHPHFGRLYLRTASLAQPLPGRGEVVDGDGAGVQTFQETMALQTQVLVAGQQQGAVRDGDPHALLRLLSGLVLAYIAVDPAVVSEGGDPAEVVPLEVLGDMVVRAFEAPS
jgi:AcrR family transcriptional regulator